MKARLLRINFNPETYGAARDIVENGLVPALRRQPGFVRGAMLLERSTGDAISIVIWDNEAALQKWETSEALGAQLARFMTVVSAPPEREAYDVAFRIPIEGSPTRARTVEGIVKASAEQVVTAAYEDVVERSLKNQPGFQAALLLVDRAARRGISVTAWDTEAALNANDASGEMRANLAKVRDHFEGPLAVRTWELVPLS